MAKDEVNDLAELVAPTFIQLANSMLGTLFLLSRAFNIPLTVTITSFHEYIDNLLDDAVQKAKDEMLDS